ncbi:TIGR02680 family protein [Anaerobranca californiensis DSM 14826]|uniref:TIGR02680 family protein n=1 Tax=Anaerobranca californiensis DSM 14826 TaxID=1120989 RepID=A0A1M6PC66_9FIRM|nr:TIGR02680 family protein [Anaerobranca californiensis]SHK05470.1 TIGR02680 family protein [Anaerobranca californiensis DSM 14826]
MADRWLLNKLGLVNFWYYDEEEFELEDGKLLLRGANGSGKSVTMQSFIPLLLDGNKRPERIDPFGTSARRIENYLLMKEGENERTAYLYIEFKKGDRYLTFGMGLKGVKGKPVDSWYFIITDGRRVKKDFFLYLDKGYEKIPLTKRELKNRLGEGNFYTESQKEYKGKVNEFLYGFSDLDDFDELMDLLINIRSPKLSKDFKPTTIYGILENSLRQLTEDDLRPMSEALENMDNIGERINRLEESLKALKGLATPYENYNIYIVYEKAKGYLEKYREIQRLNKQINDLTEEVVKGQKEGQRLTEQLAELKNELALAEEKLKEFARSDIKDVRDELEKITIELEEGYRNKKGKNEELERKKGLLREKELDKDKYNSRLREIVEQIAVLLSELDDYGKESSYEGHWLYKEDLNLKMLAEGAKEHRKKIKRGKGVLEKYEGKKRDMEKLLQKGDRVKREIDSAENKLRESEEYLTQVKEEYVENVVNWSKNNMFMVLEDSIFQQISKDVFSLENREGLSSLNNRVVDLYHRLKGNRTGQIEVCNVTIKGYEEKIEELMVKIQQLEAGKEIEFPKDQEVIKNRERLKEMGIPFLPFYKGVDFKGEICEEIKTKVEAALLDMGILDGLIIPEKYKNLIFEADGGCDKYLFPEPSFLSHNISQYLKVDSTELNGEITFEDVEMVLQSIQLENNGITYVDEKGNYGIGVIRGKGKKEYSLKYIGESARKNHRLKEIALLKEKIEEYQRLIDGEKEKIALLTGEIEKIEKELKIYPSSGDILKGMEIVDEERDNLNKLQRELKGILEEKEELAKELEELKKEVFTITEGLTIEKTVQSYLMAEQGIEDYIFTLNDLQTLLNSKKDTEELLTTTEERVRELEDDLDRILGELDRLYKFIKDKELRKQACEQRLAELGYEELKREIDFCYQIKEKNPREIERCNIDKARLEERLNNFQKRISEITEQLEKEEKFLAVYRDILEKEVQLGYVFTQDKAKDLYELSLKIEKDYSYIAKKSKGEYEDNLYQSFLRNNGILRDYFPKFTTINLSTIGDGSETLDDKYQQLYNESSRKDYRFRVEGKEVDLFLLTERISKELEENQLLLTDKEKEFFQNILIKTVSKKVSAKIHHSRNWIKRMNIIMGSMNTSSTLKLSLKWVAKKADNELQLDTNRLIEILEKEVIEAKDIEHLSQHFSSRVREILRQSEDGERKNYYTVIKEILDYRKWYEFKLYSSKEGEREKELTNNAFYQLSGGEKAMAMYVPLFTAVYSRYDKAKKDCPRIVALDEAFAGVDEENIRDMFRVLKEMDLDYLLNSQVLWGTYDTVENLAIAQIERPDNSEYVCVSRYLWKGKEIKYLG